MKKTIFLLWLLVISTAKAQTFEPPVIIDPPNPKVGDTIRVGVFHTFYPPCLTLPADNFQGLSHLFEFTGNDIRLTAVNDTFSIPICNPFPISPAPRAYYELGQLPEGAYTLETWIGGITSPLPIPITDPPTYFPLVYGPTLSFEVLAPVVIPLFNLYSLITLGGILMCVSLLYLRKKTKLSVINSNQPCLEKAL